MSEPRDDLRVIFRGRKFDLAIQEVRLANGSIAGREVVLHRGSVALLPFMDEDHVVLLRNRRYAVGKVLVEVPAGTIDPGESPEQTAARELVEETGYSAGQIEPMADWYVSPGFLNERMYLFACRDLVPGPTAPEADEDLTPFIASRSEVRAMIADRRIDDAKTWIALLLWTRG